MYYLSTKVYLKVVMMRNNEYENINIYKFNNSSEKDTLFQQLVKRSGFQNVVTGIMILISVFGLIPVDENLGTGLSISKTIFSAIILLLVIYMYLKTISEIRIGREQIEIRKLKNFKKIPISNLKRIYISRASGALFLWFREIKKIHFFVIFAPNFQREIYENAVNLVTELRKFSFTKSI